MTHDDNLTMRIRPLPERDAAIELMVAEFVEKLRVANCRVEVSYDYGYGLAME